MVVTLKNVDSTMLEILKNLCKLDPNCIIEANDIDEETYEAIKEYEKESKENKTHIYNSLEDYKKAMGV